MGHQEFPPCPPSVLLLSTPLGSHVAGEVVPRGGQELGAPSGWVGQLLGQSSPVGIGSLEGLQIRAHPLQRVSLWLTELAVR